MLDQILKLIDYLLKLSKKRSETAGKYFEDYVAPTFGASQIVFEDYLNLLYEVKRKVENGVERSEIARFLEDGRIKYLAVRIKLRAIIAQYNMEHEQGDRLHKIRRHALPKFESGILGLLRGGLATFENTPHDRNPYRVFGHTLLDVLYHFNSFDGDEEFWQRAMRDMIEDQLQALEAAWRDIADGYAELQANVLHKGPKR